MEYVANLVMLNTGTASAKISDENPDHRSLLLIIWFILLQNETDYGIKYMMFQTDQFLPSGTMKFITHICH